MLRVEKKSALQTKIKLPDKSKPLVEFNLIIELILLSSGQAYEFSFEISF
jgi:hypothetical protein